MFRRTNQDARSNPFTSTLSLASINSTAGSTTNSTLPTTNTNTNTNNNLTDEEAGNGEKPTKKGKKSKKPKRIVPNRKATPEELRAFFATLLTENDPSLADDASKTETIVSPWRIGGGVEMRQYGPAMYLEMFGREYGWILYREVRLCIRNESNILLRRPLCKFFS
jgi:hypothetical protein